MIGGDPSRSLDGEEFYWLFFVVSFVVYGLFSIMLLRFVAVWAAFHRLLRRLYWHPTRTSYETLRADSLPGRKEDQRVRLFEQQPSLTSLEFSLQCARNLLQRSLLSGAERPASSLSHRLAAREGELRDAICATERMVTLALESEAVADRESLVRRMISVREMMARLSAIVIAIFEPVWRTNEQPSLAADSDADEKLIAQANLFVAARVVDFIRHIVPQLRNLVGFAMAGVLAMMLAISVYPFPRHDTLVSLSWVVMLSVVIISVGVFVQMNRDRILSMLSGTNPGQLNWDSAFMGRLVLYAVVPILTLLGAQFPHSLGGMFSWVGGFFGGGSK
jgi:hypothetical protein